MNILVIGPVWPEPKSSAAGSHLLAILTSFIEQNWQITFASPAQVTPFSHDLSTLGIDIAQIAMNDQHFDHFVKKLAPDVVIFDRFMTEEQFSWRVKEQCPNAVCILNMEDLHCLRAQREKYKSQFPNLPSKLFYDDLFSREIAAIHRSDLSLVISDYEMALLTQQINIDAKQLDYCPFWLDKVTSESPSFEQRQDFIFIGNFLHKPNWDAVQFLVRDIWPEIHRQLPNAKLNLYGAYPANKQYALNSPKKGVLMHGRADRVNTVMREARVCLAPLRFGAGLKGKLIDAMTAGTPNVTTWIGAEGLTSSFSWPGFVANHPRHFIDAAVTLYTSQPIWQRSHTQGFSLINEKFARTEHAKRLQSRIIELIANLSCHRESLGTQKMLHHHLHKSTTYMSRWIEAKEKLKQFT